MSRTSVTMRPLAAFLDEVTGGAETMESSVLEGGTVGSCQPIEQVLTCTEWWRDDGLIVGVRLGPSTGVGRASAVAVLERLAPATIESLARWSAGSTPSHDVDPGAIA